MPENSSLLARLARSSAPSPGGCVMWTGAKTAGYGQLIWNGRAIGAHRASWEASRGKSVPPGMFVCHRCDTPVCIEPSHLFLGSAKDNTTDMIRKGRNAHGEKVHCAKLTASDVRQIRASSLNVSEAARRFGVSRKNIRLIRDGRTWKHVA